MNSKSRNFLIGGYVCLFAAGGLGLYSRGHAKLPFAVDGLLAAASPVSVPGTSATSARPRVTLIFSPSDCGAVIEALGAWNAAHAAREVEVVGVMVEPPSEAGVFERIVRGAGMEFPVRRAEGIQVRAAIRSLGFQQTPVAVVTDGRGRVRMATPLADTESGRLAPDQVVALARALTSSSSSITPTADGG